MEYNLRDHGWDEVQANDGDFQQLPAGGYVCRIVHAYIGKSKAGNDTLYIYLDIERGDFAGYFRRDSESLRKKFPDIKWSSNAVYSRVMLDNFGKVSSFLKSCLLAIQNSNSGYTLNVDKFNPATLKGLLCGGIFGQEEYQKNNGDIGTKTRISFIRTVDQIENGEFKIPALKKLDKPATASGSASSLPGQPVPNEDLPF